MTDNKSLPENISAIVFDMDGVLLDSESVSDRTWKTAAEEFHMADYEKVVAVCRGSNRNREIEIMKEMCGKDFPGDEFLTRTAELFLEIENNGGLTLMPYAVETLTYLKKKYPLALASSTRSQTVYRQLKKLGIFDFFDTITCGDMIAKSKPDPEIYLAACRSIGKAPENCAGIEDSPNGVRSSFNAGLFTIMIPDRVQPDEEIKKCCHRIEKSLKDLKDIF